jgi:hypothetical protein
MCEGARGGAGRGGAAADGRAGGRLRGQVPRDASGLCVRNINIIPVINALRNINEPVQPVIHAQSQPVIDRRWVVGHAPPLRGRAQAGRGGGAAAELHGHHGGVVRGRCGDQGDAPHI